MIRTLLISTCLAAGTAYAAAGEPAEGGPEWLSDRASVFSSVCMAAAPDFGSVDGRAEEAGLSKIDIGWHLPPEAVLQVIAHDGFCTCLLAVGAPDQDAMIDAIHGRLMQDWGESYTGAADGLMNVAPFDRDGKEAVSILEKRKYDGQNWLEARLSVFGPCASEGGS